MRDDLATDFARARDVARGSGQFNSEGCGWVRGDFHIIRNKEARHGNRSR